MNTRTSHIRKPGGAKPLLNPGARARRIAPARWALALALCAAPALALAAAGTLDCANAATQAAMNQCAVQDFQRADRKLNELYNKLQARDDHAGEAAQKAKLREAQRAWVKFRDSECAYETIGFEGGSIEPLVHASCMAELTQQRNQTLERLLKQPAH